MGAGLLETSSHSPDKTSFFDVQTQLTAAMSPFYLISAMQQKSAITAEIKTFNNHLGFERCLWQHKMRVYGVALKVSVDGHCFHP